MFIFEFHTILINTLLYPSLNEVERGVYWFHLVRLSVRPSTDRILSALFPQYYPDPFYIYTFYQTISEGVSHVTILEKFQNLNFNNLSSFVTLTLSCVHVMWMLTHWGRVTHICVSKLTIIGSDNGLSPGRRQAIIWTNAGILLIGPLGTNFSEIFNWNSNIFIEDNTFENVVCEMLLISSRPQCVKVDVWCGFKLQPLLIFHDDTSRCSFYNINSGFGQKFNFFIFDIFFSFVSFHLWKHQR